MTTQAAPYVRVYYSIIDDPKFEGVYTDDAALATWLRLLLNADAFWPASAPVPRSVRRAPLSKLVAAGLVDLDQKDHYRIHGLDAERGGRKEAAAAAANARWGKSDASGDATPMRPHSRRDAETMPLRAEPSNSSPSNSEPSQRGASAALSDDVMPLIHLVEEKTGRPWTYGPGNKTLETLRYDLRDFGAQAVGGALSAADPTHDAAVLIWAAHKALNPMTDSRSAKPKQKGMSVSDQEADRAFDA